MEGFDPDLLLEQIDPGPVDLVDREEILAIGRGLEAETGLEVDSEIDPGSVDLVADQEEDSVEDQVAVAVELLLTDEDQVVETVDLPAAAAADLIDKSPSHPKLVSNSNYCSSDSENYLFVSGSSRQKAPRG